MPTTNISHSKDNWIDGYEDNRDTNHGSSTLLQVTAYSSSPARPIMSVSLSTLPKGIFIKSAYHKILLTGIGTTVGSITYTLTYIRSGRQDWVEGEATWNIYKTSNNWGTAGCANTSSDIDTTYTAQCSINPTIPKEEEPFTITPEWGSWDVTEMVRYAYKNGLDYSVRMHDSVTAASWQKFASKEAASSANRPYLEVNWRRRGDILSLL